MTRLRTATLAAALLVSAVPTARAQSGGVVYENGGIVLLGPSQPAAPVTPRPAASTQTISGPALLRLEQELAASGGFAVAGVARDATGRVSHLWLNRIRVVGRTDNHGVPAAIIEVSAATGWITPDQDPVVVEARQKVQVWNDYRRRCRDCANYLTQLKAQGRMIFQYQLDDALAGIREGDRQVAAWATRHNDRLAFITR